MKVLFCHDGPIYRYKTGDYYTRSYTDDILARYLRFGKNITLLMRVDEISDISMLKGFSKMTLEELDVIKVPNIKTLKGLLRDRAKAKSIIRKAVSESDFIIVRLPSMIGRMAAKEAAKLGKPYFVEVVAHPFETLWNQGLKGKLLAHSESYQFKKVVKNAPFTLYVTKNYLQSEYPANGLTAGISDVKLSEIRQDVLEERIEKINTHTGKYVLGTLGGINVRFKKPEYVILAIALLKAKGITNFEYQLVGGGDKTRLQNIARKAGVENQVKFLGSMPHSEVFKWLKSIDLYMQPSLSEGLSRAIVEAFSLGLPCIGSDCGGNRELIPSDFMFDRKKNQPQQIAALLENLSKEKLKQQAEINFEKAKEYEVGYLDAMRNEFYDKICRQIQEKKIQATS